MAGGGAMDAAFVASGMIAVKSVTKPSASAAAVMNRRMANHPLLQLLARPHFDLPHPLARSALWANDCYPSHPEDIEAQFKMKILYLLHDLLKKTQE